MLDKEKTRQAFSKAAPDYDRYATFQKKIAEKLLHFIASTPAHSVLDLGCGTGELLFALNNLYPEAELHGIDLASGMIEQAQKKSIENNLPEIIFQVGDMENISYPDESFALVVSNLSLQWLNKLELCFQETARVLKPGGRFIFSIPLRGSQAELQQTYLKTFTEYPQAHRFPAAAEVRQALRKAALKLVSFQEEKFSLYFQTFKALTYSMKNVGAKAQHSPLLTKAQLKKLENNYPQTGQGLPLTYRIAYVEAINLRPV